jgi:hypothetical protein
MGKFLKAIFGWIVSHPEVAEVLVAVVKAKKSAK